MKKVLFLIHTLGAGGAEKVLVNLVNNLDSKKYDVTVMTVIDTGVYRTELADHVNYKTMFKIPKLFKKKESTNSSGSLLNKTSKSKKLAAKLYSFFWKFAPVKLIYKSRIKEKYDVEVAFLEGITAKIISSSSNKNSKKYGWIHVDLINEKKSENVFKSRKSEKKCYENFDKIICVSNTVKEQFIDKFNFDKEKVLVKYNAINDKEILEKANIKPQIVLDGEFKIITIGRLSTQKGYDRLLEIVNKLKNDNLKFKLYIIGIGPKEEELKNYVLENNLEDYVCFLGFQKNPYQYLIQANLFVCSSRSEGFSTVASEATILGVPIVTTDCSGMRELLGDSEYGVITDNDTDALYVGLKEILENKEKYNYYKEQIKLRKDFFSIKNSIEKVEELLDE